VLCAIGIVAIPTILFWLYKSLRPNWQNQKETRADAKRERSRSRHESRLERVVRYRRNAFLGNWFGVAGILAGIMLVIFRCGIFDDHANEVLLGMAVFIAGYCGVISGCWFWLKAKSLTEAIVFIAFMPLAVFFIPFVRLIFIANPAILLVGMVMMPLALVVVVFVLPDNSHIPKKPLWEGDEKPKTKGEL
jgi:hypothetical protein